MKHELLEKLRCPNSGQPLVLESESDQSADILEDWLVSLDGSHRYLIRNSIPRFVSESNYADNFGMQWNHFAKTQLDSYSGHPISAERFWKATNWSPAEMKDRWVLDVGCGSGRFTEIALLSGAKVVALDYSSAVDACYVNLKHHPNLHVVQGNIYELPFASESFDFVFCLGVLQHTPEVAKATAALPSMLGFGGYLCVDYYEKSWKSVFWPKYWLRPFTKKINKKRLLGLIKKAVPILLPISRAFGRVPWIGRRLKWLAPVCNYEGIYPLSESQIREWSVLDTFDMYSAAFDNPQTEQTVLKWLELANLSDIEVIRVGHLVGRGRKD